MFFSPGLLQREPKAMPVNLAEISYPDSEALLILFMED